MEFNTNRVMLPAIRMDDFNTVAELYRRYCVSHAKEWLDGYILLCYALKRNRGKVAKVLLQLGCRVNKTNVVRRYETALHFAVRIKNSEIVAILLYRNASVNAKNNFGYTPFHLAVEAGNLEIVKIFVKVGIFVDVKNDAGCTPLHSAINRGNSEVVQILLNMGAYVNAKSLHGITPLHIAVDYKYEKIAEMLLNHGASVDCATTFVHRMGYTPQHYACENGHVGILKLLLSQGANIKAITGDGLTGLYLAIIMRQEKVVEFLLECGLGHEIDACDDPKETILHAALKSKNLIIVEHILKFWSKSIDENDRTCLSDALSMIPNWNDQRSRKVIETLFTFGFTVYPEDSGNLKLLHVAVEKGCLPIIEDLLKYGANVDSLSPYKKGYTLLHNAVHKKHLEVARVLINNGANVHAVTDDQYLPISYAIENVDTKMVQLLLSNGTYELHDLLCAAINVKSRKIVDIILNHDPNIDINMLDKLGYTALNYAINVICPQGKEQSQIYSENKFGFNQCNICDTVCGLVKLFLNKGAEVNGLNKDGKTPLCEAAAGRRPQVVEMLLKYDADLNFKTEKEMKTPLHFSAEGGNVMINKMLLDNGARIDAKEKDGKTPLHVACENGHEDVVITLLEYGADIDSVDNNGVTPLQLAILRNSSKIVEILLNNFTDVEIRDNNGKTALHYASENQRSQMIQKLLDYGSNVNVECNKHRSPLEYAEFGSLTESRYGEYCVSGDSFEPSNRRSHFNVIVGILDRHIAKLKALDIYVAEKNLLLGDLKEDLESFDNVCKSEAEKAKNHKIGDTDVSYHDLLTKDINQLAMYARNEKIVKSFELNVFSSSSAELPGFDNSKKFPIYWHMILANFEKGKIRERLLQSGMKSLKFLTSFTFPEISYLEIMKLLSNKDLHRLTNAGPKDESIEAIP